MLGPTIGGGGGRVSWGAGLGAFVIGDGAGAAMGGATGAGSACGRGAGLAIGAGATFLVSGGGAGGSSA